MLNGRMPVAQKRLLIVGGVLIFIGLLFAPAAVQKNWSASNTGGIILSLGQAFILLSVGAGMLARGE